MRKLSALDGAFKKEILRILLFLLVLGGLVSYLLDRPDIFESIKDVNLKWIAVLSLLSSLFLLLNGLILRTLLRPFKIHLAVRECFRISCFTAAGNCLISFGGGTTGKALYLKKKYNFPYPAFMASTLVAYILDILCASVLGVVVILFSGCVWEEWGWKVLSLFLSTGLISFFLITYRNNFRICDIMFLKHLVDISEGWNTIAKDKGLIVKICLLVLVTHVFAALALFVGYTSISVEVGIAEMFVIVIILSLSGIVRVTPGNLGIQESIAAFTAQLLGIGFDKGLMAAGLLRLVEITMIFFYSGLYSMGSQWVNSAKSK